MNKGNLWRVAMAILVVGAMVASAAAVEPLVLFDFEGNDEGQVKGGEASMEQAKTGKASRKWGDHVKKSYLTFEMIPEDWSAYNQISFWLYSAVANDEEFIVQMMSENDETEGGDYYSYEITVNWTGWKHFELPFWRINKARTPAGWDHISKLSFIAKGWNNEPKEDTLIYVDDIRLEKVPLKMENGSLEDENGDGVPDGWYFAPAGDGTATMAEMVEGRTGKGIKLVDTAKDKGVGLRQNIPAKPGETVTFKVWKKGDPVAIYVMSNLPDKKHEEKTVVRKNDDPEKFEQMSVTATVPEAATSTFVWIYSYSTMMGTRVVDDAEIEISE